MPRLSNMPDLGTVSRNARLSGVKGGAGLFDVMDLKRFFSIDRDLRDYGAVADDLTDNTPAFAAAAASGPGVIRVPPGVLRYSQPFTIPDGQAWVGLTSYITILRSMFLNGHCIHLGNSSALRQVRFASADQRTSGATVVLRGNNSLLRDFEIDQAHLGVLMEGASINALCIAASVENGLIRCLAPLPGSGAVDVQHFGNAKLVGLVITGTGAGPQCDFGIRIRNGDTAFVTNVNATHVGYALLIAPGVNENAFAVNASGCYFDSAAAGIDSAFIGGPGNVYNTLISNTWFGLAGKNGLTLAPSGSGLVDGLTLTGCEFTANGVSGMVAAGANVRNVVVSGGHGAANPGAALAFGGAQDFVVQGFRAGSVSSRGPNGQGISITGAANGYTVTGNNLRGNLGAALTDSGTGPNKLVANNLLA